MLVIERIVRFAVLQEFMSICRVITVYFMFKRTTSQSSRQRCCLEGICELQLEIRESGFKVFKLRSELSWNSPQRCGANLQPRLIRQQLHASQFPKKYISTRPNFPYAKFSLLRILAIAASVEQRASILRIGKAE